jgi:hypothetical protein
MPHLRKWLAGTESALRRVDSIPHKEEINSVAKASSIFLQKNYFFHMRFTGSKQKACSFRCQTGNTHTQSSLNQRRSPELRSK